MRTTKTLDIAIVVAALAILTVIAGNSAFAFRLVPSPPSGPGEENVGPVPGECLACNEASNLLARAINELKDDNPQGALDTLTAAQVWVDTIKGWDVSEVSDLVGKAINELKAGDTAGALQDVTAANGLEVIWPIPPTAEGADIGIPEESGTAEGADIGIPEESGTAEGADIGIPDDTEKKAETQEDASDDTENEAGAEGEGTPSGVNATQQAGNTTTGNMTAAGNDTGKPAIKVI